MRICVQVATPLPVINLGKILIPFYNIFLLLFLGQFLGVLGNDVASRLSIEVKTRNLNDMGQCKAGLEVDFVRVDTYQRSKRSHASRKPRSGDTVKTEGKVGAEINVEARTDTGGSRSFSFSVKGEAEFRVTRSKRQSEDGNVSKPGSDINGSSPSSDNNGSNPGNSGGNSGNSGGGGGFGWRR